MTTTTTTRMSRTRSPASAPNRLWIFFPHFWLQQQVMRNACIGRAPRVCTLTPVQKCTPLRCGPLRRRVGRVRALVPQNLGGREGQGTAAAVSADVRPAQRGEGGVFRCRRRCRWRRYRRRRCPCRSRAMAAERRRLTGRSGQHQPPARGKVRQQFTPVDHHALVACRAREPAIESVWRRRRRGHTRRHIHASGSR